MLPTTNNCIEIFVLIQDLCTTDFPEVKNPVYVWLYMSELNIIKGCTYVLSTLPYFAASWVPMAFTEFMMASEKCIS